MINQQNKLQIPRRFWELERGIPIPEPWRDEVEVRPTSPVPFLHISGTFTAPITLVNQMPVISFPHYTPLRYESATLKNWDIWGAHLEVPQDVCRKAGIEPVLG